MEKLALPIENTLTIERHRMGPCTRCVRESVANQHTSVGRPASIRRVQERTAHAGLSDPRRGRRDRGPVGLLIRCSVGDQSHPEHRGPTCRGASKRVALSWDTALAFEPRSNSVPRSLASIPTNGGSTPRLRETLAIERAYGPAQPFNRRFQSCRIDIGKSLSCNDRNGTSGQDHKAAFDLASVGLSFHVDRKDVPNVSGDEGSVFDARVAEGLGADGLDFRRPSRAFG